MNNPQDVFSVARPKKLVENCERETHSDLHVSAFRGSFFPDTSEDGLLISNCCLHLNMQKQCGFGIDPVSLISYTVSLLEVGVTLKLELYRSLSVRQAHFLGHRHLATATMF
jgi:hypothetical protein